MLTVAPIMGASLWVFRLQPLQETDHNWPLCRVFQTPPPYSTSDPAPVLGAREMVRATLAQMRSCGGLLLFGLLLLSGKVLATSSPGGP